MKKYMMIFLGADYGTLGLSPEEMQAQMGKWFAWGNKMEQAGIVRGGEALQPEVKRISGKGRVVTDHAGGEVKELVGGYYTIEVKDMAAAMEVAQEFPDYELGGTVEIREVMVFDR